MVFFAICAVFIFSIILSNIPTYQKVLCEENKGVWETMLFGGQCVMDDFQCKEIGGTPKCGDGIGLSCKQLCEFWEYENNPTP